MGASVGAMASLGMALAPAGCSLSVALDEYIGPPAQQSPEVGHLYLLGGASEPNLNRSEVFVAPIRADGTLGDWTASTPLTTGMVSQAAFVREGLLYSVGSAPFVSTFAPIVDGNVGSWVEQAVTIDVTPYPAVTATDSVVVAMGGGVGCESTCQQCAPGSPACAALRDPTAPGTCPATPNSDGAWVAPLTPKTPGTWQTYGALSAKRCDAQAAAYQGYAYVVGGSVHDGYAWKPSHDVEFARVADADAQAATWRKTGSDFPSSYYSCIVVARGRMYSFGGNDGTSVHVAALREQDGGLEGWQSLPDLRSAVYGAACAEFRGVIYVVGGGGATFAVRDVWMAPIAADGTPGAWRATTPLPEGRIFAAAVAN